jgi:hypothetical protein
MVEASLKETESRGESTRIGLDVVLLEIDYCEMEIQTRLGWHGRRDAALRVGEERNCFLDVRNLASLVESGGQIECQIVEVGKMTGRSAEGWRFTKRAIRSFQIIDSPEMFEASGICCGKALQRYCLVRAATVQECG